MLTSFQLSNKLCLTLLLSISSHLGFAASKEKEAPSWVSEVATRALPAYSGKVPAAVLLNEERVTVDSNGSMNTLTRHAVKILTHEGKQQAEVVEGYEKGGRSVKELRAWLVAPGGFVKTFEKSSVQDLGVFSDELYNDYRLRRIRADNAEIGSVFVYESEVTQMAMGAQDLFTFQVSLPEIESKYSITVPSGWTVRGTLLNHEPLAALADGNTYTWTLKNLPFRANELSAPHLVSTSPTLAIDFQPAPGITTPPAFKDWSDVAHWHSSIAENQADLTPEMAAKVRELTAGATSEYDKIRALGHYVQKVRYIEIAMDLSHNGGYRPHFASEVFAKQYGDCKDKANLLRSLLRSAGVPSYLVAIYSGDRTFVKKEWASPWQFNHMVLAIQVSDAIKVPTAISTSLGRVLIFDPTDDKTPMGDLPFYEQGSFALLCAAQKGSLVQMPIIAPDANLMSENIHATLEGSGKLTAQLSFESKGQAARLERGKYDVPVERYKAEMEHYLDFYAKAPAIQKLESHDAFDQNTFSTQLNFDSVAYAQIMQGRLLIFNPNIVQPAARHFPVEQNREQPIVLNSRLYKKRVAVQLPDGFKVDEMPASFHEEQPFASFKISYKQEAGQILVEEELRTEAVTLPASEYQKVKKFFDSVYGANSQNAVLVKN